MIGSWVVEAAIRFGGNGVQYMERLGVATRATTIRQAELTGQITAQEAAYLRLKGRMDSVAGSNLAMISRASGAVALVGAAGIADAVVQAAKLQQTLIAIRNETGANNEAMERFYNTTFRIANIMGVAPSVAGDVMLNISRLTASTMTTAQMQAIAPTVAGFASTINFNRPDVSVEDATVAGIQMAHQFRAYRPDKLESLMDKVYRLSGLMVESPRQAVRQMRYYEPLFKGLNIDDNTSIAMMALLDRAGFRQKVGTNVRAMMLQELGPLQLTKHFQQGQGTILEHMGVFGPNMQFKWNTASGGVDFIGMLQSVARWAIAQERAGMPRETVAKDLYGALGKQGGTIGMLMADPQMLQILGQIRAYLHNPAVSLAAGERNRQASISYQAGRVWGNFQADLTELGFRATWAAGSLKTLADNLHNFQQWMHSHSLAADWIGDIAAAGVATAGLGAAANGAARFLRFAGDGFKELAKPMGTLAERLGVRGLAGAADGAAIAIAPLLAILAGVAGQIAFFKEWTMIPGQYKQFMDAVHSLPFGHPAAAGAHGGTTHVHIQSVHLPHVTNAQQFVRELSDPRSSLYNSGGIRTSKGLPRPLTTKPR